MTKEDLIAEGKRCFNFNPDLKIDKLSDILEGALYNYSETSEGFRAYLSMVRCFAKDMARFIDQD